MTTQATTPPGFEALWPLVTDPSVTAVHRLPMRAPTFPCPDEDAARRGDPDASPWWRSLDGEWELQMLSSPLELTVEHLSPRHPTSGSSAGWSPVVVPGAWTLQRDRAGGQRDRAGEWFDRPHYTNVVMPFDEDPPAVPAVNPTGVYRRSAVLPREWAGRRCVLRIGAAESIVGVWLDGRFVGASSDSRLPAEFDLTPLVRPGRRFTLVLVVVKWSAQTWLEDQDQWWHGGIQRSVTMYSTAASHLADVGLLPGLVGDDVGALDATLTVAGPARREPGWTVELSLEPLGAPRRTPRALASTGPLAVPTWDGSNEVAALLSGMFVEPGVVRTRLEVPRIVAWSHEHPVRYRALVSLRDPAGALVEVCALVVGFRSVEVRERELLVNGRPVLLHGVNLHEHDPERGRAVHRALTRQDLTMMKAHNLNAVRAAHYPHDEHLAELCDELGLYLVDEANVESHGRQTSLCHDPAYASSIVERVQRMVLRDRHHPSIILWSLGNESGDGAAHHAAAGWVRSFDPTRPLHYEGPLMHDLHAAAPDTDVVCPMYPTIDAIVDWATSGRDRRRPLIMCEYSHAMGNSNGSLADYWNAIEAHHGLQGGFIWEWVEHGLPWAAVGQRGDAPAGDEQGSSTGPGGRTVWAYGGDFGDRPHDANFVCDGLVSADRAPHPSLAEVHWVGRPVSTAWADERRTRMRVRNRRWFSDLADLEPRWSLAVDGDEIAAGVLEIPRLDAQESVDLALPMRRPRVAPGSEVHLTVRWVQRRATPWAPRGHEVAHDQLELTAARAGRAAAPPGAPSHALELPARVDPFDAVPTVFRALTDNDGIRVGWMRGLGGQLARWVDEQGLDRCEWEPAEPRSRRRDGRVVTHAVGALRAPGLEEPIEVRHRVEVHGDGWRHVGVAFDVPAVFDDLPRVGLEWVLPADLRRVEWFGDGPHECYPDRRASATVGRWSTPIDDTYVDHVLPQEHGHRTGVRWLALRGGRRPGRGRGLLIVCDPTVGDGTFGMAVRRHRDAELWAARHTSELTDPDAATPTVLYLDAAHRGLGTASCGPDVLERYRVRSGRHAVAFWCRALASAEDASQVRATLHR